nr:hypothetical protein [Tanacetum cinerariifolium]
RTVNVAGAREKVGSPVVQQSGIQCFNCREFGHFTKECRKPKRVKDSAYHKEKMLLCKQAKQAHYSYMAKIQEVPTANSGIDSEPVEQQEMHADLKYVESLEKGIHELQSDKAEFSDMYDVILQECVSKDVMCSYLMSLSDLDALDELQCNGYHQKDKIKAKPDKTEHEMKSKEKSKVNKSQPSQRRSRDSCFYDDDDDGYNFAIIPNEPDISLSMGDEHLHTIPEKESDKFIKSSVENLVPNPSESEGENECDVPAYEAFTTFSNTLFDSDYDFYSNPHHFNAESDLIESMLNHNSSISSSSKIDSLFDEFAGELTLLKSIPPGIDETDCDPEEEIRLIEKLLYDNSSPRPPEEFNSENSDAIIDSFSPSPILVEDSDSLIEEIDLSFTLDYPMPPGIKEDDYDFERDILILEKLLSNNFLSLLENESFPFDIPPSSRPPAKPPDGNRRILNVKMMGDISEQKKYEDSCQRILSLSLHFLSFNRESCIQI